MKELTGFFDDLEKCFAEAESCIEGEQFVGIEIAFKEAVYDGFWMLDRELGEGSDGAEIDVFFIILKQGGEKDDSCGISQDGTCGRD